MKAFVPVNNDVVRWAVEESGLLPEDISRRVGVDAVVLRDWMDGVARPSQGEFTRLFRALKRPSALFFAPRPPARLAVPSFRGPQGPKVRSLSESERLWIRRSRRLQKVVSFLLEQQGQRADLPQVGRKEKPDRAAELVRRWLGVGVDLQLSWDSSVDPWRWWRTAFERHEVLVFALQLGPDGIRGFSFYDEIAPVISANTAYNRSARVFTAFHELGHLILRNESLCVDISGDSGHEERWCEEFAASVLLPAHAVLKFVDELSDKGEGFGLAKNVAARFKVSIRAAAVRLIHLQVASRSLYALVDENAHSWDRDKGFARGRPTYRTQRRLDEYGALAVNALIRGAEEGLLNLHDLSDYLRVDTTEVGEMAELAETGW